MKNRVNGNKMTEIKKLFDKAEAFDRNKRFASLLIQSAIDVVLALEETSQGIINTPIGDTWIALTKAQRLLTEARMPRYLMEALSDEAQRIKDDRLRLLGDLPTINATDKFNKDNPDARGGKDIPSSVDSSGKDNSN